MAYKREAPGRSRALTKLHMTSRIDYGDAISDSFLERFHQLIGSTRQTEAIFGKIRSHKRRVERLDISFVSLVRVVDFSYLSQTMIVHLVLR